MSAICPACGLAYDDFRTGLDFAMVRAFLWDWSPEPPWPNVTRHTVLGRWRQMKLEMWVQHTLECGDGN